VDPSQASGAALLQPTSPNEAGGVVQMVVGAAWGILTEVGSLAGTVQAKTT